MLNSVRPIRLISAQSDTFLSVILPDVYFSGQFGASRHLGFIVPNYTWTMVICFQQAVDEHPLVIATSRPSCPRTIDHCVSQALVNKRRSVVFHWFTLEWPPGKQDAAVLARVSF
ncbi:Coproheme decarboxylase [Trichinella spiralis]|uniref:Coproheme decarboxylase n=1 Tax=Trichinella spiralis TaxID=6334 RepID=A0ABR3KPY7_TRISP